VTKLTGRRAQIFDLSALVVVSASTGWVFWLCPPERYITAAILQLCFSVVVVSVRLKYLTFSNEPVSDGSSVDGNWRMPLNLVLTALGAAVFTRIAMLFLNRWAPVIGLISLFLVTIATISLLSFVWRFMREISALPSAGAVAPFSTRPPSGAKFLLLLIPRRYREHLVGDLEEEYYTTVLPEYGLRTARRWYWWHVCISIGPLIWAKLRRVAGIVLFWKSVR
jgi:hypothetical protein